MGPLNGRQTHGHRNSLCVIQLPVNKRTNSLWGGEEEPEMGQKCLHWIRFNLQAESPVSSTLNAAGSCKPPLFFAPTKIRQVEDLNSINRHFLGRVLFIIWGQRISLLGVGTYLRTPSVDRAKPETTDLQQVGFAPWKSAGHTPGPPAEPRPSFMLFQ